MTPAPELPLRGAPDRAFGSSNAGSAISPIDQRLLALSLELLAGEELERGPVEPFGVFVQAGLVSVVVRAIGVRRTLMTGLLIASVGWALVAASETVPGFLLSLIPAGIGVGLCNASIVTLVSHSGSKEEQGTVQGAAGALESLGRTIGPLWGHGALQRFGEGSAYATAAIAFFATTFLVLTYQAPPTGANGTPAE